MKVIELARRVLAESKVDLTKLGITDLTVDTDLPAEAVTSYETNLLTRERAESDPDISRTMMARAYKSLNDGFDRDFNAFAEANLPKETADKVKAEQFTRNKWELLRKNIVIGSGTDPEKVTAARKEIETLHNQLKERDAAIEVTKNNYEGQLTTFQKNYLLTQKLSPQPWAEPFNKPDFLEFAQGKLTQRLSEKSIILELSNGQLIPRRKDAAGQLLDVYEANVKVGLDDLIKKELGEYLKQSAGAGSTNPPKVIPVPGTAPQGGLTLAEMQRLEISKKFKTLQQ